jgi:hypothetical protein
LLRPATQEDDEFDKEGALAEDADLINGLLMGKDESSNRMREILLQIANNYNALRERHETLKDIERKREQVRQ